MPNPLAIAGAQPPRPSRKAALYQGARFSSGLWTNRSPLRDAASERLEEKFYGPRGDALIGGQNVEITQRLTLARRPGNSVWNSNLWQDVNSFYGFRLFNSNTEKIKTIVDTTTGLYDASDNGQSLIWGKSPYSGQSYMQSVGNVLFWGDGINQKKWINTLQTRIPYSSVLKEIVEFPDNTSTELNPYNFTPYDLSSFVTDSNGNAQQLIGVILQLSNFYILNSTVVFTMKPTDADGNPLPTASQVLSSGLQVYFPATSVVAGVLGGSAVTLTINNIVGKIDTSSVYFGGSGYAINDIVNVNQNTPSGSMNGQVKVMSVGGSTGTGYSSALAVPTTTTGVGSGATLNITASGGLVSATVASGGINYALGDYIFPQQTGGSGGFFIVTGVSVSAITSVALCTGVAETISTYNSGEGYYTAENITTSPSTGSGVGMTINITDDGTQFSADYTYSGGSIVNAVPSSSGSGYTVGDPVFLITPTGSTAKNGELEVSAIYGNPATLSLSSGGPSFTGYTPASGLDTTTSGSGIGATFNILTTTSGQISTYSVGAQGSGYAIGDNVSPVQATGSGASYVVSGIYGPIASASLTNGGPSFTGYTVANDLATTTSGSGTGCKFDILTVNASGQITTFSVGSSGGSGYAVNDLIYPTQASGAGAVFKVATLSGSAVATMTSVNAGYLPYTTGTVSTTTSGTGIGATINITAATNGVITAGSIVASGSGYAAGDKIYPTESGTSGTAYFTVVATTNTTGGIAVLTVSNPGYLPYTTATGVPTNTSGSGTGLTINITGVSNGAITSGVVGTSGSGYKIGDKVYPIQAGTPGNATFLVASLSAATGGVASLSVVDAGTGYEAGSYSTTSSGAGTGLSLTLVVSSASYYPPSPISDMPTVYSGGNPISSYTPNENFIWNTTPGGTTIDGSALWYNRGSSVDGGLVYNWGVNTGTIAPSAIVNGASTGWKSNTYYNYWQFIIVTVGSNKYIQQLVKSGVSGSTAPTWATTSGQNTKDGTAEWVCLSNDDDTSLSWTSESKYSVGHVITATPSTTNCVYQLQPYSGIMFQGNSFPVYCWQCNSQSGGDVGAAGELPSGFSGNVPMSQKGTQPTSTATYTGTMSSLYYTSGNAGSSTFNYACAGDGTISSTPTQTFPSGHDLSIVLAPSFVIPSAGDYTFQCYHMNSMFWGMGNGSISLNITNVGISAETLTVTCDREIDNLITSGIDLTFGKISGEAGTSDLENATFLNGKTVTVLTVSGKEFTASFSHGNYGPGPDSGTVASSANLVPTVISGPTNWHTGSPNTYNFSTGTPISGYPIMGADYVSSGQTQYLDTFVINFPAAGVYPAEIYHGVWDKPPASYSYPTISPALPGTPANYSFMMVYSGPNSTTLYNILPESLACSQNTLPTFPNWPSTLSSQQAIAPSYPSVTETSGNFTWWNLGPVTTFDWTASVNLTTSTYIIDPSSNKEIPYEAGVSGTTEPTFGTILNELVNDLTPLVWMNDGTAGSTPVGSLTTSQGGWKYCIALVNTLDNTVSNASPVSNATGSFFDGSSVFVSGGLPDYIDPQIDYVAIFRTQDGGATYYLVPPPASGNGNTEYTIPISQYISQGFTDTNTDQQLQTLFEAPLALQNSIPPKGSINLAYQDGRIFVSSGNTVYWSSGASSPVGNGYNGFNPNNYAEFPSLVKRMVPLNIGIVVFTVSDIYVITGNGTTSSPFSSQPFIQKLGLLNYNALTVNGSIIYFLSTDHQCLELNVGSGLTGIGFPIADKLQAFDPNTSYLTWHVNGVNDQCLFVVDGSTGWYRMCPTPAPEPGQLTWSPKANVVGGCGAVKSIETSPGEVQCLVAPAPGVKGPILYRDYTNFEDNGNTYPASFILGSIVMAYPGQIAIPEFITTDCSRTLNSHPITLGVRVGEISGPFESLDFWSNDPPQLPPSETMYNQRFYFSQTKQNISCRHLQLQGSFAPTNSADELNTLTIFGGYLMES